MGRHTHRYESCLGHVCFKGFALKSSPSQFLFWKLLIIFLIRVVIRKLNILPPNYIFERLRTSLVVQWVRIHLLTQGPPIRSLVWEDPPCCGTAKPLGRHAEPELWSQCSAAGEASTLRRPRSAVKRGPHLPQLEEARCRSEGPHSQRKKWNHL